MQIFAGSLEACGGRPESCLRCRAELRPHRHGHFTRHRGAEGSERVVVLRYRCPRCGCTFSVIPAGMFPRRSLPVERFQALADQQLGRAGGGARPPPASVIEEGCIRRALKKLSERAPFLCGLLGQLLPLRARDDLSGFWRALRELGPTEVILGLLARDFKTSLLGCYRSLEPPDWRREPVPA